MKRSFQKKIKEISKNQVEEYSHNPQLVEGDSIIGGERSKRFVRFSGDVFSELIEEIQNNPNTSFDTYLNEVIKEGYTPEYVSVLIKKPNNIMTKVDEYGLGHFRDVIASKVLNYFECPTTYETLVKIDGKLKSCSVDFNKPDEDLYMAHDLLPHQGVMPWDLDDSQFYLTHKFNKLANELDIDDSNNEMFAKLMDDYIYSYLVRKIVIQDSDYGFHNMGIIHNKKENILYMAPNFDFEYCFMIDDYKENLSANRYIVDTFKYVKKYYPKVFDKFSNKFEDFIEHKVPEQIIKTTVGDNEDSKIFIDSYNQYLTWLNKTSCLRNSYKSVRVSNEI